MHLDWTDFPDAPERGAFLCDLADIPDNGVLSKDLGGYPILVLLVDGAPRAYVNACPHQFLPLDQRSNKLRSADGLHLLCSNHTAIFRADDGMGTAGEGEGCQLSLIPTTVIDGAVHIST